MKFLNSPLFRLLLVIFGIASDQYSKWLVRAHFILPDGSPDYFKTIPVIGEWLQFRLVFNSGAAFGMRPQSLLPFLHPTLFYLLISILAISGLFWYYSKLPKEDWISKLATALIFSGAIGNLTDRVIFHKVTDFLYAGIPGVEPHWPNFNLADSWVCIGVVLIIASPLFAPKPETVSIPNPESTNA